MKERDPLGDVRLLYVGRAAGVALLPLLKNAQQASVLTVTDTEGALQSGSVINFRIVDDRVRFEISLDTAERSGLKVSSRLVPVAYHVERGSQ